MEKKNYNFNECVGEKKVQYTFTTVSQESGAKSVRYRDYNEARRAAMKVRLNGNAVTSLERVTIREDYRDGEMVRERPRRCGAKYILKRTGVRPESDGIVRAGFLRGVAPTGCAVTGRHVGASTFERQPTLYR